MRLPLRSHFRHDGKAKKKFTEQSAKQAAVRSGKNAYRCWFCGAWHVGGDERSNCRV